MLPFIQVPSLGPIQPFGVLVAIGVMVGAWAGRKYIEGVFASGGGLSAKDARKAQMWASDNFRNQVFWCVAMGFVGAHLIDVLFYQPNWYREDPLVILKLWQGISSYGGFVGAVIAYFVFAKKARILKLEFVDAGMYAILVGWIFGRSACATVHDHLGAKTDFVLGVQVPEGFHGLAAGGYHDLGLYEAMYTVPLVLLITLLARVVRRPGFITGVAAILYSIPRFFLEYLRPEASDPRYGSMTAAQWFSILMVAVGAVVLVYIFRSGPALPRMAEALERAEAQEAREGAAKK